MDLTFDQFLSERYLNVFGKDDKAEHAQDVYDILQASYKPIGGLKGNGFQSPEAMMTSIPFWKMVKRNGKVVAVAMYKDKNGRKRVAVGSDGSDEGKAGVASIFREDFQRAYFEISGRSLKFHVKILGYDFLKKFAVDPSKVEGITGDKTVDVDANDEEVKAHPQLKQFFYAREIGGHHHTKILLGTPGKKMVITDE